MTVPFNSIPSSLRTPFTAVEFDGSKAQKGPALLTYRGLIIGQKTSAGAWTANTLQKVTSEADVIAGAGRGSQLHLMVKAWRALNKFTELWVGVLADNGAGVAATGTFTVTGTATASGTLPVYVGDVPVPVSVAVGDAQNAIATAIAAAITANLDLPLTATATTNVVTTTARNKGTPGNDISLRVGYQDGDAVPAGVSVAVVAMASGATNPTLATLLAAKGDAWFHIWAHPYTDSTSLTALETELERVAGPLVSADALAITSAAGTVSTLGTLGTGRNEKYNCIVAQPGKNPLTSPCEFAARTAALVAYYGNPDPARPFQTLPLTGAVPPVEADRFTVQERNTLLLEGVATTEVGPGGVVQMGRLVTTYQKNASNVADTAYLDATTILTLMYARYSFRARMTTKFPRHKLRDDGDRIPAGQPIITPKLAKAEAVAWFRDMEDLGLFENGDQFKRDLVVERDAQDPNRLNFLLPPDLVNQLIVTAAQIQFRL
jgi:phage tail sheath gpL-like